MIYQTLRKIKDAAKRATGYRLIAYGLCISSALGASCGSPIEPGKPPIPTGEVCLDPKAQIAPIADQFMYMGDTIEIPLETRAQNQIYIDGPAGMFVQKEDGSLPKLVWKSYDNPAAYSESVDVLVQNLCGDTASTFFDINVE